MLTAEIDQRLNFLDDPIQRVAAANAIKRLHWSRDLKKPATLTENEVIALASFHDIAFLFLGGMLPEPALREVPTDYPEPTPEPTIIPFSAIQPLKAHS